jgi:DNA-binding protein HU-beta
MAKNRSNDLFSSLRSQGIRKRVARALADLESGGRGARGNAEKVARRVIADLRSAADGLEKRLDIGGAGTRSSAAKKAARTRKRTTARRSTAAKKGAAKRSSTARKTGARKTTARKTTARKTTARKSPARKTAARKTAARKRS